MFERETAELEAEVVSREVEEAAEKAAGDDGTPVEELAKLLHEAHPTYALEILEGRIATRARELVDLRAGERARLARDIQDRAQLVVTGQQSFDEALAAIVVGYPGREEAAVRQQLERAVQHAMAGGAV